MKKRSENPKLNVIVYKFLQRNKTKIHKSLIGAEIYKSNENFNSKIFRHSNGFLKPLN